MYCIISRYTCRLTRPPIGVKRNYYLRCQPNITLFRWVIDLVHCNQLSSMSTWYLPPSGICYMHITRVCNMTASNLHYSYHRGLANQPRRLSTNQKPVYKNVTRGIVFPNITVFLSFSRKTAEIFFLPFTHAPSYRRSMSIYVNKYTACL